jgi:hypothetical protein
MPMDDELPFESDPLEPLEVDSLTETLLRDGARRRGLDPVTYLGILLDCERRGVKPLWRQDRS